MCVSLCVCVSVCLCVCVSVCLCVAAALALALALAVDDIVVVDAGLLMLWLLLASANNYAACASWTSDMIHDIPVFAN